MSKVANIPIGEESPETPGPELNLAGSIGKNTVFGIISSLVQVATRLVTVPIIIAHLGLAGYGIWSIVMVTATYMRFGSIGVKSAFQKYVAEATGKGDFRSVSSLLSTGTAGLLVISISTLIPTSLFSNAIARASGVPVQFLHSAAWSISILALILAFSNAGAAYEAIVMGGHRIDLTRKFGTFLALAEASAMVAALKLGYGLVAMSAVMAVSEILFVGYCYLMSRQVLPQIQVRPKFIDRRVIKELVRFAGSYQLVSILQLVYGTIAPIAVLRAYGATQAGVFALASRLVSPVMMCIYAFLLPILSSSAMVFASGSTDRMRNLLAKSFKVTLGLTVLPLALVCAFGTVLLVAWTGETDPSFRAALCLLSLQTLFQAFSLLGLVLYRASGKAVLDNFREILRIAVLLPVALFARKLGFLGVLGGMAFAEFVGMCFMLFSLSKTYHVFDIGRLLRDFLRLAFATLGIILVAGVVIRAPFLHGFSPRALASLQIGVIGIVTLLTAYPLMSLTGVISSVELKMILSTFRRKHNSNPDLASTR
jgi:O-antigen/teichoic acid export membrane protein